MKRLKQYLKSKTLRWSLALAVFGVLEMHLVLVKDWLGEAAYGALFIVVATITAVLRLLTSQPIGDKP